MYQQLPPREPHVLSRNLAANRRDKAKAPYFSWESWERKARYDWWKREKNIENRRKNNSNA